MKKYVLSQKVSLLNEKLRPCLIIWHQLAGIQEIKRERFRAVIFPNALSWVLKQFLEVPQGSCCKRERGRVGVE